VLETNDLAGQRELVAEYMEAEVCHSLCIVAALLACFSFTFICQYCYRRVVEFLCVYVSAQPFYFLHETKKQQQPTMPIVSTHQFILIAIKKESIVNFIGKLLCI